MIWKTMKRITVLLSALANLLSSARSTDADDARPNIVFIIVDDQSPYDGLPVVEKNARKGQ